MSTTVQDPAEIREAARRLNEEAKANWHNPQWRAERAAEMTESIYENFRYENILDYFGAVEYLNTEDRAYVRETQGLKAYWIARGGYIEQSTVRTDVVEIPRDTVGFHVSEFEDKMLTGFAEASSTMVDLGIQRLGAAVNLRALKLFEAAIPANNSGNSITGTSISLASVHTALREVRDETRSGQVAILGRATVTEQLMDSLLGNSYNGSGFLPASNEEMVRQGKLGTYRGAPVITVPNYLDEDGNSYWPAGDLWVVANDAAKFAFFGGLKSKEFTEQDNWYWHYLAKQEFGGLVNHPERAFRITDTNA
jgi:hypothetical protein